MADYRRKLTQQEKLDALKEGAGSWGRVARLVGFDSISTLHRIRGGQPLKGSALIVVDALLELPGFREWLEKRLAENPPRVDDDARRADATRERRMRSKEGKLPE